MTRYQTIQIELEDRTAILTLNRPEARNALDEVMRVELPHAIRELSADDQVAVVILTGAGGAFCAGGDLKAMMAKPRTAYESRQRIHVLHEWLPAMINLEKPLIAAVDGAAFGGGFSMALAADFVLASPAATFCQVFARVGLVPDMAAMYLLPRVVGLQRAKEIMFSARVIGAEEATSLGIVLQIHPAAELMLAARTLAAQLASASGQAMALMKNILNQSFDVNLHALGELESYAQGLCMDSEYHKEATRRFLAGEPLAFQWGPLRPGDANTK